MPNLDQLRLDAIYSVIATDALITPNVGGSQSIRAIDKTAGVQVGGDDGVSVQSISPACDVRATELATKGIDRADLDRGTVEIDGMLWRIIVTAVRPGIYGEAGGEVRLILQAAEATA